MDVTNLKLRAWQIAVIRFILPSEWKQWNGVFIFFYMWVCYFMAECPLETISFENMNPTSSITGTPFEADLTEGRAPVW